jgi:hypothetical protein
VSSSYWGASSCAGCGAGAARATGRTVGGRAAGVAIAALIVPGRANPAGFAPAVGAGCCGLAGRAKPPALTGAGGAAAGLGAGLAGGVAGLGAGWAATGAGAGGVAALGAAGRTAAVAAAGAGLGAGLGAGAGAGAAGGVGCSKPPLLLSGVAATASGSSLSTRATRGSSRNATTIAASSSFNARRGENSSLGYSASMSKRTRTAMA